MGTTNSKPPITIITIDQSELLSRSQVQFITLFSGGAQLFYDVTSGNKTFVGWQRHGILKEYKDNFWKTNLWRGSLIWHLQKKKHLLVWPHHTWSHVSINDVDLNEVPTNGSTWFCCTWISMLEIILMRFLLWLDFDMLTWILK